MPVAGATEAITVGGETVLDNREVPTGATYRPKELESIPTTRDPWAILRQAPGVLLDGVNVGGGIPPPRPIFVGKGSHPDQNSYELDGVAISLGGISPIFFDFDSLSDIEVATGGSDPSLATPGVTLSVVTKRGTNESRARPARFIPATSVGTTESRRAARSGRTMSGSGAPARATPSWANRSS